MAQDIIVGLVGPCAAGKTTLKIILEQRGITVKHIAQEHSYVKDMWQRLAKPDILVYLDVTYSMTKLRRNLEWTEREYNYQIERLSHARRHADLYILTDPLSQQEVAQLVVNYLAQDDKLDITPK